MHEQGSRRVNGRMGSSVFCTDYLLLQETIIPIRKYDRSILILNKTFNDDNWFWCTYYYTPLC